MSGGFVIFLICAIWLLTGAGAAFVWSCWRNYEKRVEQWERERPNGRDDR